MIRPKKYKHFTQKALPLDQCIAKTVINSDDKVKLGLTVEQHCMIVGFVAKELIACFPEAIRKKIFPIGAELVAAVHDVGKICPTFQEKIRRATEGYTPGLLPELAHCNPEIEKNWGGHAGVSQAATEGNKGYVARIVGRHHGVTMQHCYDDIDEVFGGLEWKARRQELVNNLGKLFSVSLPEVTDSIIADAVSGLTTVADWIGSGMTFEGWSDSDFNNVNRLEEKAKAAIEMAGFLQPQYKQDLSFSDIFGFNPNPVQEACITSITDKGVYILEAPMGIGKTEAALYAAYRALVSEKATGVYFALPTQLTSNMIQERMNRFLDVILSKESPHRHALLLHGNAWLVETEIGEDGRPGKSWFDSTKRGVLAPFAVGTVDQALMAAMQVKHGFVRTFGLAGKVVVLDEIHTYDSYTGTILDKLIKVLKELHCTVVVLTATLTKERRRALLEKNEKYALSSDYPLLSQSCLKNGIKEYPSVLAEKMNVACKIVSDEHIAVEEALARAEEGQQILWIENTVAEAQAIYKLLAARATSLGVPCGLLHSRFTKNDRKQNEALWVDLYGRDGQGLRKDSGRILIGTQVLEQSLDIDADFLVTRLCPTDMLLQRTGRLWRHRANDKWRGTNSTCETWILSPNYERAILNPKLAFGKSAFVYAPYVLCRSLEVFQNLDQIQLPADIRQLIEDTYYEREEENSLVEMKQILEREREKLGQLARIGLAGGSVTLPESKARTRYADGVSCDLLLLRSCQVQGKKAKIMTLDGNWHEIPLRGKENQGKQKRIAALLAQNMLSVPERLAPEMVSKKSLAWLKGLVWLGNDQENPFRIALVDAAGFLTGLDQSFSSKNYVLRYESTIGYTAEKKDSNSSTYLEDW